MNIGSNHMSIFIYIYIYIYIYISEVWGVRRLPIGFPQNREIDFDSCSCRACERARRSCEGVRRVPPYRWAFGLQLSGLLLLLLLLSGSAFGCKIVTTLVFWADFRSKRRTSWTARPLVCTIKHVVSLPPGLFSKSHFFDFGS